jgi:hypothetical protein
MEFNMKTDLLNMFNRFANYLEKNNSLIRIKIENDNIMFNDQAFVFGDKHDNTHFISWFVIVEKLPLETQINCFFFGKNCESAKNSNIPLMVSIFEYCNNILLTEPAYEKVSYIIICIVKRIVLK